MDPLARIIVAGAVLGLFSGVMLLIAGLRGRRIDDHPVCGRCRFDLTGVCPGAAVCPECGRTLSVRSVRIGQRRRRPGMAACGGVLLTPLLGGGTLVGVQTARGFNWNPYKPTWLLTRHAGTGAKPVLDELALRLEAGQLRPHDARRVVHAALQSAGSRPRQLGDLVASMWERGLVDDTDAVAFLRSAGGPDVWITRRTHEHGAVYRVYANAAHPRGATSPVLAIEFAPLHADLDGEAFPFGFPVTLTTALPAPAGLTNGVEGQLLIFDPARGTVSTRWRATATSHAGARAGESLGTWEVAVETLVPEPSSADQK